MVPRNEKRAEKGRLAAKNTGTVLLCSLCVGACIWIFDAVAMLAVKSLLGVFAG